MKKIFLLQIIVSVFQMQSLFAQQYYLPLNRDYNLRYEPYLYNLNSDMHTAVRPFMSNEVAKNCPFDSLNAPLRKDNKFNNTWVGRKLFKEHLLEAKGEDYNIYLDPVFEFQGSMTNDKNDNFRWVNTRGIWVSGNIGERFSFSTSFYESQARFPDYIDSMVRTTHVVPGGARIKNLYGNFDYDIASGTISYSLKKYFNFQFGHDKIFIGDGYRSLLFSDNAFNFPFLKITTTIWKIKYMNLFTVFQDLNYRTSPDDGIFTKKYGSFHFLDFNIGKRASFGLLEAIIWKSDTLTGRGFDINYVNPFIFFRPVEFSIGSPDNALIGFNFKYKISSSTVAYSQILLDEFKIREVRSGRGWWSNKQAVQAGVKTFNILSVKDLHLLTEFNFVRPYTYQHKSSLTTYGHYNESITHPLGANFWESVSIVNYKYKNFTTQLEIAYALIGYDLTDSVNFNYGQNIFESYIYNRPHDYGNRVGQGLKTKQLYTDFKIGYLLNPKSNLTIEAGATNRIAKNIEGSHTTTFIYFGIRTALTNRYYDF
jgi:hypothetical protein